jgi:hypothetical protein
MKIKNILYANILLAVLLLSFSCVRQAPSEIKDVTMTFNLPSEFDKGVYYSGKTVKLTGTADYEFTTDVAGMAYISSIIPGIYDIVTSWEMTGAEYKKLIKNVVNLEDNARVLVNASITGQQIFKSEDLAYTLNAAVLRDLMISKVYYSGTRDNMDRTYTVDSYVEIFNNADDTAYLDGKYLALAESVSPAAYPAKDNSDSIYARQICRFPGKGRDFPIAPGGCVVIAAKSARNHTLSATNSVDLSDADFEVKAMEGSGNPAVRMLPIVSNSTNILTLNLISGGPNAIFLFETDDDVLSWPEVYQRGKTSGERFRRISKSVVIDAVECLKNNVQTGPDVNTKRFQSDIDAGYACIDAVNGYNHESLERKVSRYENGRYYLVDTNNSSEDFAVQTDPTPRRYDKTK